MRQMKIILSLLCIALAPAAARAGAVVGGAVEVAPGVQGSRSQMWPRAAWCEGSKTWLVAWREGHTTDMATDIWCARVSAGGKTLDPGGIKVCSAADNQERPWVASDGKGFLVAWEDFRNEKDYDVYAARVSAEGKVLDKDGFLVAGGAHNQCHPVAAFAGGNYYVAWQAFTPDPGRYLLHGARVSADGKVLDAKSVTLTPTGGKGELIDAEASADNPVIAASGDRVQVGCLVVRNMSRWRGKHGAIVGVDPATGQVAQKIRALGPAEGRSRRHAGFVTGTHRMPALAWGKDGGLFAAPASPRGGGSALHLWRLDASGKETGPPQGIPGARSAGLQPLFSIAFDGAGYLVTLDRPVSKGRNKVQVTVQGYRIPASGAFTIDPKKPALFPIAADGGKDQMQGFAAPGPAGAVLVSYVEVRGADDLKVMARVVKSK